MATWWIPLAATAGLALYMRQKTKAGQVRWVPMTEEQVKQLPAGLVLAHQIESGPKLPKAPAGYKWKLLKIMQATTPLTPPQELQLHVLEEAEVGQYLTPDQLLALGSSYMTYQEFEHMPRLSRGADTLFTEQGYEQAPTLQDLLGLGGC